MEDGPSGRGSGHRAAEMTRALSDMQTAGAGAEFLNWVTPSE